MTTLISVYEANNHIVAYERTDAKTRTIKKYPLPLYFYLSSPNGQYDSIYKHLKFDKVECESRKDYKSRIEAYSKINGLILHETSISFTDKILLDNYIDADPVVSPNVCYFDIEVDFVSEEGFPYANEAKYPINAITLYFSHVDKYVCIAVPPKEKTQYNFDAYIEQSKKENKQIEIFIVENEYLLLFKMCDLIRNSDILSGWNSRTFDITYIVNRCKLYNLQSRLCFENTKDPTPLTFEIFEGKPEYTYDLHGRVHIDYKELFQKFTFEERQSYALDSICEQELKMNKLDYGGITLDKLYNNDFERFVQYNIHDVILLKLLNDKFNFMKLAVHYAHECCSPIKNVMGTLKITQSWINKFVRNANMIVPDKAITDYEDKTKAEGAIVLQPKSGIYKWMSIIDVNSLYPSVIRAINISPETIVGHFTELDKAYEMVINQTDDMLEFNTNVLGMQSEKIVRPAKEWYSVCIRNGFSISPFGVLFNQNFDGVIPLVLADGYAKRKSMQKQKAINMDLYKQTNDPMYKELANDFDKKQHVQKIALNSLYGALLNDFFVYFDKRLGASVTGAGRCITKHMGEYVHNILTGTYSEIEKHYDAKNNRYWYNMKSDVVIYGDTDSIQFSLAKFVNNKEAAILLADHVSDKVNEFLPSISTNKFLVQDKFKNIVKVGRELVSDIGIYYTRKKYVLHVVDLEGSPVDKFKSMGTDEKKSNNPKKIQGFLHKLFEMILKEYKQEDDVNTYISEVRKDIRKNILDYGMPKTIKNLEKYRSKLLIAYADELIKKGYLVLSDIFNDTNIQFASYIIEGISWKNKKISIDDINTVYNKEHFSHMKEYLNNETIVKLHNSLYIELKSLLLDQSILSIQNVKCTMPGHVRAAINYNLMLMIHDDNISPEIESGNKIKLFYISPKNKYKFKSFAFTTDTTTLPEWFEDNFKIDISKMMVPLIEKKILIYINTLGWRIDSESTNRLREVFSFIDNFEEFENKNINISSSNDDDELSDLFEDDYEDKIENMKIDVDKIL